jgi:hypothetical protein
MIVLFHRESHGEPNTFTANIDGSLIHIRGIIRRTVTMRPSTLDIACYVSTRDRTKPATDLFVYPIIRLGAESWRLYGYRMGLNEEKIFLANVPEAIGNAWNRAGIAA